LFFNYDFIIYIDRINIAASSTENDDVTVTHRIFTTNL